MSTHNYPRPIITKILWWNYHSHPIAHKHIQSKFLEGLIDFYKERNKDCWNNKFVKFEYLYKIWYPIELELSQDTLYKTLKSTYDSGQYPKHLKRNFEQALEK